MKSNPLDNLIGLYCIDSWCGYAGHLKIDLSRYPDKLSLLADNIEDAEWRFETVSAAWRLTSNQTFQTGGAEDTEHNNKRLKAIVGSRVIKIEQNNRTDISIFFDNGFQLDTFLQGEEFPPFELCNRIKETNELNVIQLTINGEWKEPEDSNFVDEDKLASIHSENTEKRWKDIVPAKSLDNHCSGCAYFLTTSGRFYFWDFGICSNSKSSFDGKVVGVQSSCEHFEEKLNK